MATAALHVKHGWVWAIATFIFFFNSFLLPEGLTYVLLLTPVWLYLLHQQGRLNVVTGILMPFVLYAAIHLVQGVDVVFYFRSVLMMASIVIFLVLGYSYINNTDVNWDLIFRDIAVLNFILTVISVCLLYVPSLSSILWYRVPVTKGIVFPRLKMFTGEASHYSYLFATIAIYFYSRALFFKTTKPFLTLVIVTLPLILSFSMGVLSCMVISCIVVVACYFKTIFPTNKKETLFFAAITTIAVAFFMLYRLYPGNILFVRIQNIFSGEDTSARGRTYEAFILANKIIAHKSMLWGIGPGQLKLAGRDIIINYYNYYNIPEVIRIPNACAETIVCFGYAGLAIRLAIEIVLFSVTRVYRNPYRLWLFVFLFIYQFTGSYITNGAEYLMWIIAFSSIFPEYERLRVNTPKTVAA